LKAGASTTIPSWKCNNEEAGFVVRFGFAKAPPAFNSTLPTTVLFGLTPCTRFAGQDHDHSSPPPPADSRAAPDTKKRNRRRRPEPFCLQLGENGRVVIPAAFRRRLNLLPGDELVMRVTSGRLTMTPTSPEATRAKATAATSSSKKTPDNSGGPTPRTNARQVGCHALAQAATSNTSGSNGFTIRRR
jgi:AbrB family looped-hinge helix DNA binding protein